jgi:hypothetical protein
MSLALPTRLVTILAFVGLAFAPVAPSIAWSAMAMPMTTEMPDGMPCCPDDQPAIPDCAKDCPFAVVCTAVVVSATAHDSPPLAPRMLFLDRFPTPGDAVLSSLIGDPPPRPPKA